MQPQKNTWGSRGVLELSTHAVKQGESGNISLLSASSSDKGLLEKLTSCRNAAGADYSETAGVWRLSLTTQIHFHLYLVPDAIT